MHTQHTLHLTNSQVSMIEETLSNSDYDVSDTELVDVLVANGVFQHAAEKSVELRQLYLSNIFIGNNTPLRNGSVSGFKP